MNIRKYAATDRENVIHLLRLNTPAFFSPAEEKDLIHYLGCEVEDYFVMESDAQIVGCGGINYLQDHSIARISWDIFHPDFQGRGLGRKLTQFRIERIRAQTGIQTISVRTSQMVFRFYEKMGFDLVEVVPDYWAQGYDLYRMELQNAEK